MKLIQEVFTVKKNGVEHWGMCLKSQLTGRLRKNDLSLRWARATYWTPLQRNRTKSKQEINNRKHNTRNKGLCQISLKLKSSGNEKLTSKSKNLSHNYSTYH